MEIEEKYWSFNLKYILIPDEKAKEFLKKSSEPDEVVSSLTAAARNPEIHYYLICEKRDGRLIGYLEITDLSAESCFLDLAILEHERNRHYGSEALKASFEYIFQTLGFKKIQMRCNYNDRATLHLFSKFGFKKYETLRRHSPDVVYAELSASDFH